MFEGKSAEEMPCKLCSQIKRKKDPSSSSSPLKNLLSYLHQRVKHICKDQDLEDTMRQAVKHLALLKDLIQVSSAEILHPKAKLELNCKPAFTAKSDGKPRLGFKKG